MVNLLPHLHRADYVLAAAVPDFVGQQHLQPVPEARVGGQHRVGLVGVRAAGHEADAGGVDAHQGVLPPVDLRLHRRGRLVGLVVEDVGHHVGVGAVHGVVLHVALDGPHQVVESPLHHDGRFRHPQLGGIAQQARAVEHPVVEPLGLVVGQVLLQPQGAHHQGRLVALVEDVGALVEHARAVFEHDHPFAIHARPLPEGRRVAAYGVGQGLRHGLNQVGAQQEEVHHAPELVAHMVEQTRGGQPAAELLHLLASAPLGQHGLGLAQVAHALHHRRQAGHQRPAVLGVDLLGQEGVLLNQAAAGLPHPVRPSGVGLAHPALRHDPLHAAHVERVARRLAKQQVGQARIFGLLQPVAYLAAVGEEAALAALQRLQHLHPRGPARDGHHPAAHPLGQRRVEDHLLLRHRAVAPRVGQLVDLGCHPRQLHHLLVALAVVPPD